MGMYTRLTMWPEVKDDPEAVAVLHSMFDGWSDPSPLPPHPLFSTDRWRIMLRCSSYCHQTGASGFRYDTIAKAWFLNVDSSFKNYDDEIAKFLDWLEPYLGHQARSFIGFFQYEEDDEPTLLYVRDGKIVHSEVTA